MRVLADMALFVEVANTRHFGRAATALGIPASTLSRRIAALERELGVALVNRSTRSFALTETGEAYYRRASKLVGEAKQIHEDLEQNAGRIAGRLRIGIPLDLAVTVFPPILGMFMRHNPGISLEVLSIYGNPNPLSDALDAVFLVVHEKRLPSSSQIGRMVGSFPRFLYASDVYLKRRQPPQEPSDLEQHACIRSIQGTVQTEWELRKGRQRKTVAVNGEVSVNSAGLLAWLTREHLGIATLPHFLASHPCFGGGLTQVLPDWEAVPAYLFAFTATRMPSAKVLKLIEAVKAGFPAQIHALERAGAQR